MGLVGVPRPLFLPRPLALPPVTMFWTPGTLVFRGLGFSFSSSCPHGRRISPKLRASRRPLLACGPTWRHGCSHSAGKVEAWAASGLPCKGNIWGKSLSQPPLRIAHVLPAHRNRGSPAALPSPGAPRSLPPGPGAGGLLAHGTLLVKV